MLDGLGFNGNLHNPTDKMRYQMVGMSSVLASYGGSECYSYHDCYRPTGNVCCSLQQLAHKMKRTCYLSDTSTGACIIGICRGVLRSVNNEHSGIMLAFVYVPTYLSLFSVRLQTQQATNIKQHSVVEGPGLGTLNPEP